MSSPAAPSQGATPLRGSAIVDGKYRLEEPLGGGGMGVVYRARHLGLDRPCAVKLILPRHRDDPSFFRSFQREAELLAGLDDPHVVRVTDFGVDPAGGGTAYLVMDLLTGETLENAWGGGGWSPGRALPVLAGIAAGLDHAHDRGVLHGDLKAENVLLTGVGDDEAEGVRLLDFGLARRFGAADVPGPGSDGGAAPPGDPARTQPRGTPLYLAPEVGRGLAPTTAADVYAFGVLAYRTLCGRFPFLGDAGDLARQHLTAAPPAPSALGLPGELDAPLLAALAKDPRRRPASAGALVAALATAVRRAWWRRQLPRRLAAAASLAVVTLAAAAGLHRLPAVRGAEDATLDLRFRLAPAREPDPRLLLLTLDDGDVERDGTPLAGRDAELAALLDSVLRGGAERVAVDHLLPPSWGESRPFVEVVLRHPGRLALAVASTAAGDTVGGELAGGWIAGALGAPAAAALFAHSHLDLDADGTVRRARRGYRDAAGGWRPTLAGWLAGAATEPGGAAGEGPFLVDHRVDARRLPAWSWREARRRLAADPAAVQGRLVLVGGVFTGSGDQHRVPGPAARPPRISGVALQALAANTLLAGAPLREAAPGARLGLLAPFALAATAAPLLLRRHAAAAAACATAALLYATSSAGLFAWSGVVTPLVSPLTALALTGLVSRAVAVRLPRPPGEEGEPP